MSNVMKCEKKSFGYRGYTKLQSKNYTKEGKLACLRQMNGNVSSETETVQDENQGPVFLGTASFKLSRLEKLRACREEKDLKKLQLKSKRPPFKPSGTLQPHSGEKSPMEGQIKAPTPSFIPRIGSLKPPTIFVKKRTPKETKQTSDLKPLVKKVSTAIKSRDKKDIAVQFESLSPGFPPDISYIQPVSNAVSFAPAEFNFSGIENIEQFDFLPAVGQPLPESVTRRSTPISSKPASSSIRPKGNTAVNDSSKGSSLKPRSVLLETTNILSPSQSTANKSSVSGSVKPKLNPKKQYLHIRNAAGINSSNSMSKSSELSSSLPRNEKGKVPGKNQPGATGNKQDKHRSLPVNGKAQQCNSGKNSRGSVVQKRDPVRIPPAISARTLLPGKGGTSESVCRNKNSIKDKASRDIHNHLSFKSKSNEASLEQNKSGSKVTKKSAEGSKKAAKGVKDDDKKAISKQNLCKGKADIKVLPHSVSYEKLDDVSNKTVIKFSLLKESSAKEDECKIVINSHALEDDDKPTVKPILLEKEESSITMMKLVSFEEIEGGNTIVIKSSSLGENEENNQTVIKSVVLKNYDNEENEETVLKSNLLESNRTVTIKAVSPQENENGHGGKTVIIKYSSHQDDENGDKSLTKSLPVEENEDKVVIKSVLAEQRNDDEKVSVRPVLDDGDPIIQPILISNENYKEASPASFDISILTDQDFLKSNVLEGSNDLLLSSLLNENATFDEGITKVIDSRKMTTTTGSSQEFKLKNNTILLQKPCNICKKSVCHCVYDMTPSPTKEISTPAPAKEMAVPAPIKAITTPASTTAIAPLNELTIVSSQYNSLENARKESVMKNSATDLPKAKALNEENFSKSNSCISNQTLSSSHTSANEEQLPQQKDCLSESKNEVVLKSTNDVTGNSCEDSVATAIPSVIDAVSERGSSSKLHPLLNQSLLFSGRTSPSSKRISMTNKITKSVHFSRQMSEVSFIDDEIMPDVNLDGLDNTLNISRWSDIWNTPRTCRGIKFLHYQEIDVPKIGFSDCIEASEESFKPVSPSTLEPFDLLTSSEMEAGKSYLDLSVSSNTDVILPSASKETKLFDVACASKETEVLDIRCASKETGILDIEHADEITCKTSVVDETTSAENDVPLSSISLLGSPQVPNTPRKPLPENLIAFSPFIKF